MADSFEQREGRQTFFVDSDHTYLYLGLEREEGQPQEELVIPIDVTKQSGSQKMAGFSTTFERKSDFVLLLHPKGQSRL
ncbi:hypothetical protein RSW84_26925, partial [Escherichia coli]|uniref:hypothetical protein n=1 Tax=Escherichia coli TaxID=562 RepID=UPI0028DF9653